MRVMTPGAGWGIRPPLISFSSVVWGGVSDSGMTDGAHAAIEDSCGGVLNAGRCGCYGPRLTRTSLLTGLKEPIHPTPEPKRQHLLPGILEKPRWVPLS